MRAGKLRKRITIQALTETVNDYGERVKTPTTVKTVWGELTPLLAGTREAFATQGSQFQARVSYQARMRWTDLSPATNQLVVDGVTYEITGIMDPDGRQHELLALCWMVQA